MAPRSVDRPMRPSSSGDVASSRSRMNSAMAPKLQRLQAVLGSANASRSSVVTASAWDDGVIALLRLSPGPRPGQDVSGSV